MKNVFFFTNIASHYRKLLWLYFLRSKEMNFHILFGDPGNTGIKEIDFSKSEFSNFKNNIFRVKNFWLGNKIIIWQSGVIFKCLFGKVDVAIFTSDMYCISTWIAAIISRLRNKKVIFGDMVFMVTKLKSN